METPPTGRAPGGLLVTACILAAAVSLGAGLARASTSEPALTIGVIAELTGAGAPYGRDLVRGAEMAVRDVNAAGGINGRPLALMVVDGGTDPARSAIVMRRLAASDVPLVVGGWGSAQVLASLEVAERAGLPYLVVGATNPRITSAQNRWTLRVIQSDAVQAQQLARIVIDRLGARRVAVLSDSNAYGAGSRDVFLGSLAHAERQPVSVETYLGSDQDFSAPLARIKAASPDVLAIFGTLPAAATVMNQARRMGIGARFVGTGGLANEALIAAAPQASNGTLLTGIFHEDIDSEAQAWVQRYRSEFAADGGDAPRPLLAAWEYRAIQAIAAPCLRQVGIDRARLYDCIARWRGRLFGIAGETHFDATGQLVQPPLLVEVRDRTFRLWTAKP